MTAIASTTSTTRFTKEEIDHFGDTLAYTTTDPQTLGSGSSSTSLSDSLVTIMESSTGTGVTQFAADQSVKALSNLAGLKKNKQELDLQRQQKGLRTQLLQVGSRSCLGLSASAWIHTWNLTDVGAGIEGVEAI